MSSKSPKPQAPPASSTLSNRATAQRKAAVSSRNVSRGTTSRPRQTVSGTATTVSQAPAPPTSQQRYDAASAKVQQVAPTGKVERQNYQTIILMEYVGCLLLTSITPIATKKQADGLSPYAGRDMIKLGSITLLYFILAVLSVGGRGPGRFAAWFGGLILIVDGMLEASNLAKDFGLFTGGLASAVTGQPATAAPAVGLLDPSLVQNVSNAALNPPGLGQ